MKTLKKRSQILLQLLVLILCELVESDVYLHNPRGSNNRLDESTRERKNDDRLFDSQNNARGGYNVGEMYYYAGSQLTIEWTNQHSCGRPNTNCEIVIQYMCSDNLRDGTSTSTIPVNNNKCDDNNCNTDERYGMNEDYDYYMNCIYTMRNQGLFTAEQKLDGETSQYTRQNPKGTQRGYECPEERDYYPYWRPTPWKDIVVMTSNINRCNWYRQESENVKPRFACIPPDGYISALQKKKEKVFLAITKESCEKIEYPKGSGKNGIWKEIPKKAINPPECIISPKSRDNHNGNGVGGFANTYNWTIPNDINENCALRLRYNISTGDFPITVDSLNNTASNINIGPLVGLSDSEASKRGYVFKANPVVQPLKTANAKIGAKLQLQLAINTAQFGRTFQDRSHKFSIKSPPAEFNGTRIYNLNVRGKRGNIVQVYPAVEYDYVPSRLTLSASDALHIQWTGSDSNPDNNAGQGRAKTDRSNIILLKNKNYPEGIPGRSVPLAYAYGHYGNNYPMKLNASNSFLGFTMDDMIKLAILRFKKDSSVNAELNNGRLYFDLGPRVIPSSAIGTYYYMCTRNNNFSNRSQKGKIIVLPKKNQAKPNTKRGRSKKQYSIV